MPGTIRVGLGHDTHRLEPGGPLRIGGIDIPFEKQAVGHSDADVLLHAITDAILGAAALGDIGQLYPDTDPANRGKDSGVMLQAAAAKVAAAGYSIVNLDCVILAERPKILPHRDAMRARIAELLALEVDQVSLKGKTGEKVGEVGRGEIVQAMVVCLISR
jgi:2-C-methyl-D-erythritol 2,4-cyclodiphosphate synthase